MPSFLTLPKFELDTLELFFTHILNAYNQETFNTDRIIPYFRFKSVRHCVFAYMVAVTSLMVATPMASMGTCPSA